MRHTRRTLAAALAAVGALVSVTACQGGSGLRRLLVRLVLDVHLLGPVPAVRRQRGVEQARRRVRYQGRCHVKRTAYDTTDLGNKALLAAQQGNAPDVMLLDNPVVSTLVAAGILNKTSDLGLDTSSFQKNIIGAGTLDGAAYGVPIGANTLALYYNKKVLSAAHVDPA